jgi:putative GTP pyrophosphokinase
VLAGASGLSWQTRPDSRRFTGDFGRAADSDSYCAHVVVTPPFSKKQLRKAGRLLRDIAVGDRTATNDECWEAVTIVEVWRATHAKPLARINAGLRYYVQKAGSEVDVTQRLKRFSTIVDKLQRHPSMQLNTMEDIGGVRAVLRRQSQVDGVVRELLRQPRWTVKRVREYVSDRDPGPKPDGYRAVHVVVERDGCFIEIQLRTPWQDAWAQSVEQDTRRLRAGLKFGLGPADLQEYFRVIAEYFELRERDEEPEQELLAELSKMFAATRRYYADEESQ